MTSNDNGKNAFTSDEATKIICTALTNGSLVLPLNKKLQDLGLVQFVKLCAGKIVINDEDDVEEVFGRRSSTGRARSSRRLRARMLFTFLLSGRR